MRGDQRQSLAAVCRTERKLLSDHPSHRNADHVGPVPGKIIQDPNRVIGHCGNGAKKGTAVAIPDTQVVVVTTPVVPLEIVDLRPPHGPGHPKTHDEQDGRPLLAKGLVGKRGRRRCTPGAHSPSPTP